METPGCPWRGQTRSGRGGGPGHLGAAGRKGGEEGRVRGGCTRQKPAPEGEGLDLELVAGGQPQATGARGRHTRPFPGRGPLRAGGKREEGSQSGKYRTPRGGALPPSHRGPATERGATAATARTSPRRRQRAAPLADGNVRGNPRRPDRGLERATGGTTDAGGRAGGDGPLGDPPAGRGEGSGTGWGVGVGVAEGRGGGGVGQPGATRDRTRPGPEEPRLSGRSGVEDPELVLGPGPKPL